MEEPQEEEMKSLELETRATRRSKIAIYRNVKSGELWFWLLGERRIEESWEIDKGSSGLGKTETLARNVSLIRYPLDRQEVPLHWTRLHPWTYLDRKGRLYQDAPYPRHPS
jgi:hypothetical protein